jgi:hypothetical protein
MGGKINIIIKFLHKLYFWCKLMLGILGRRITMARPAKKQLTIKRMRMKDIVAMLIDVIYIMCDGSKSETLILINRLTDITPEELEFFNIAFPDDKKE